MKEKSYASMQSAQLSDITSWTWGNAQHKHKKSRNTLRDDTIITWRFKKLCFQRNLKEVLN